MEGKRAALQESARAVFTEKGFKDASIGEITQRAGLAVGTFYLYFESKEKLFIQLLLEENERLKRSILSALDLTRAPLEVIRQTLALNQEGMRSSPILREWYNKSVFDKIEQAYREQNGVEAVHFMYDTFLTLVETWQAQGRMRSDIDSRTIMTIFAALVNVDTHKAEIGLEHFPQLLDVMTELIVNSLTGGAG